MTRDTTNVHFAAHSPLFRKACELAGVPPTKRQAGKFRRGEGKAYAHREAARQELETSDAPT